MKEQICMLWVFFKHPAGVLDTPAQLTVAELYASLKGKCYLGFPNSRYILCVDVYCATPTQMSAAEQVSHLSSTGHCNISHHIFR